MHKTICIRCDGPVFRTKYGPVHESRRDHPALTREQWFANLAMELEKTSFQEAQDRMRNAPTGFLGNPACE